MFDQLGPLTGCPTLIPCPKALFKSILLIVERAESFHYDQKETDQISWFNHRVIDDRRRGTRNTLTKLADSLVIGNKTLRKEERNSFAMSSSPLFCGLINRLPGPFTCWDKHRLKLAGRSRSLVALCSARSAGANVVSM
jgi:hypothetical protein